MTITNDIIKAVLRKLFRGEDYRIEIVNCLNDEFLRVAISFFKDVINAKLENQAINEDWYKKAFLDDTQPKEDIALVAGLNMKTIHDMRNTTRKEIVIEESLKHYESLLETIRQLTNRDDEMDITLTVKLKDVSVDLNLNESLLVINTLAVKRSALRGGVWSSVGKRAETPLMLALCDLYSLREESYETKPSLAKKKKPSAAPEREGDFYLVKDGKRLKCEVKLMGKGNPESMDAVIARDAQIFIADKLSDSNKRQLDAKEIQWVELRSKTGFRRFKTVLDNLGIPCEPLDEEGLEANLEKALKKLI